MSQEKDIVDNVSDSDEVLQWVTFQLENETYGVNVMQVQEVLRYSDIAPVPGARPMSWVSSTCAVTSSPLSTPVRVSV